MLTLTAASAALAAPGTTSRGQGTGGGGASRPVEGRIQQALLGMFALDSRLHAWRTRLASLQAAAADLRLRRAALRQELGAAQASYSAAQSQLARTLRALYERGNVDPVAVMLGATSLSNGVQQLDELSRVADASRQTAATAAAARRRLLRSRARLAAAQRRLAHSVASAQQVERTLSESAAARLAYVSSLRTRQQLQTAQVQSVVATARTVQQKSQRLQPVTSPPPAGGHQLVVSATCYDLPGKTATGMPVGRGVVAVDPAVIPLGTRMHVPGYGDGVAADVGGGIHGNVIDLWFPTFAECAAWGRRTVTITIY